MLRPCHEDLTGICHQRQQFPAAGATGLPPSTAAPSRNLDSILSQGLQGAQFQVSLAQSPQGPNLVMALLFLLGPSLSVRWQFWQMSPCLHKLSRTSKPRVCLALASFPRDSTCRVALSPHTTARRESSLYQWFSNIMGLLKIPRRAC